jgi:hypothetical protein
MAAATAPSCSTISFGLDGHANHKCLLLEGDRTQRSPQKETRLTRSDAIAPTSLTYDDRFSRLVRPVDRGNGGCGGGALDVGPGIMSANTRQTIANVKEAKVGL